MWSIAELSDQIPRAARYHLPRAQEEAAEYVEAHVAAISAFFG